MVINWWHPGCHIGHRRGESHPFHQHVPLHPTWRWRCHDWVSAMQQPLIIHVLSTHTHYTWTSNNQHEDDHCAEDIWRQVCVNYVLCNLHVNKIYDSVLSCLHFVFTNKMARLVGPDDSLPIFVALQWSSSNSSLFARHSSTLDDACLHATLL